mgnify:CR=1 FL=1
MLKSFKYKLLPTLDQKVLFNKHFGCSRFVFNYFLNERKEEYLQNKKSLNFYDNAAALTTLKKSEEFSWLKEVNSQTLQTTLKNLDGAYNNFFKFNKGFPKFKSKKGKNSFTVPQYVKVVRSSLVLPKFKEPIKFIEHRKLEGVIKYCTISKTSTEEYFVSILVETEHNPFKKTGRVVGIDLGIKDFVITSDNKKYKNNRYTKTYQRRLKRNQQDLSRKIKGSNNYSKQKLKLAKTYKKITNSRLDNLHKVSTELIKNYDIVILEDLNVKGMVKNPKLAKHISDVSWSHFTTILEYKAKWNHKRIVKVGRFFPSSKTCNVCGHIHQSMTLSIREWKCPNCQTVLDRDINAAKNILAEGMRILSDGTSDYRSGEELRPGLPGTLYEASKVLEEILEA